MSMTKRENLMKYAEEVAYSSKGHFKAADWTKISTQVYIGLPLIFAVILIVYQDMSQTWSRLLNCISMIFSLLALMSPLVSNQDQACKRTSDHMVLGNQYLDLYSQIRDISTEVTVTKEHIDQISKKKRELDTQTHTLQIPLLARFWSWAVINKEMDLGWIYEK